VSVRQCSVTDESIQSPNFCCDPSSIVLGFDFERTTRFNSKAAAFDLTLCSRGNELRYSSTAASGIAVRNMVAAHGPTRSIGSRNCNETSNVIAESTRDLLKPVGVLSASGNTYPSVRRPRWLLRSCAQRLRAVLADRPPWLARSRSILWSALLRSPVAWGSSAPRLSTTGSAGTPTSQNP
jgi:hypothetical protein